MLAELSRCISVTQQILSDLSVYATHPDPRIRVSATDAVAEIAAVGLPRIEDHRVPEAINDKLHAIAEQYVRKALEALPRTHAHLDLTSLRRVAHDLRATYTSLYERKVIEVANLRRKSAAPRQKQPFANDILLYAYDQTPTPSRREREMLASLTGMTVEQVRVWFQNRRSRTKKKAVELQTRPVLQLNEVLERVKTARKADDPTGSRLEEDYDSDDDSGYCAGSEFGHRPFYRESKALSLSVTTQRSYPAPYVPQPLSTHGNFDPLAFRRTTATHPPVCRATVTVDELSHSMARLCLRQRRRTPCSSSSSVACKNAVSAVMAAVQPAPRRAKKSDREAGRKLAGGQRAASAASNLAAPAPILPAAHSPEMTSKGRKKSGPARRKPAGKVLSRQPSDVSVTSMSSDSSSSSRTSSYGSDFSFGSAASDLSFTSVESASASSSNDCLLTQALGTQQYFDICDCFPSHPPQPFAGHQTQVPVYDLSSITFDPALAGSASDLTVALPDTTMVQLLQSAETYHHSSSTPMQPTAVSSPIIDVGIANLATFIDFSSAPFPNLEALLSTDYLLQAPMELVVGQPLVQRLCME